MKIKTGVNERELSDSEYEDFIQRVLNLVHLKHEFLLTSAPKKEIGRVQSKKQAVSKTSIEASVEVEEEPVLEPLGEREEYMTIDQCAKFLGRSKVTIHEYKKQGMPCYKIGRTVKFKKSEVLEFMRQQDRRKR